MSSTKKLYVGNLSLSTTREMLEAAFKRAGDVEWVGSIKLQPNGKNWAPVTMTCYEDADRAIAKLNGKDLGGSQIEVKELRK